MEKWKKIGSLIIIGIGIISLLRTIILNWNAYLLDFSVYYHASKLAFLHGNPYSIDPSTHLQYLYPPFGILFLLWLPILDMSIMQKIWILLSVAAFITTIYALIKIKRYSLFTTSLFFLFCVTSFPFKFTLGMGQINLIVMVLISLFMYYVSSKLIWKPSFFLSLAISLKLFPVLFFIPLFLHKKIKAIAVSTILLTLLIILSLLYFGMDLNTNYITHMALPLMSQNSGIEYYNQSLGASLNRMGAPSFFSSVIKSLVLLITIWFIVKQKFSLRDSLSLFISTILLINSVTWQHHLVLLMIPLYLLLEYRKRMMVCILIVVAGIMVSLNITNISIFKGQWYGALVLSHGFFGLLLIWLLQLYCYTKKHLTV